MPLVPGLIIPDMDICYAASKPRYKIYGIPLEYPIRLNATDGSLVHALYSGTHNIEVREGDGLRWMHFGGDAIQAMMELDEPSKPIIPYQVYMLAALMFNQTPNFVLNLGVGGGSFERFFSTYLPEISVTSVESNPDVIGLLRECFLISERIPVINQDAAIFLADCVTTYDVILCDLFDHTDHPSHILSNSFYSDAFRCISTDGVFVINLLPETESGMVDILLAVRTSFKHVLMLQIPHYKNILLFCLKMDAPGQKQLELRSEALSKGFGIDLIDVPDRLIELPDKQF